MSDSSFTTVTSRGWFSRIGSSIGGTVFGLVVFLLSFVLLVWNEGRAVQRAKTLDTGAQLVVNIEPAPMDPQNNGSLVHVTGEIHADEPVVDPEFGIEKSALKLRRSVEMYQWNEQSKSETRQKLGGGEETTTTYTYRQEWHPDLVDSSQFAQPQGHGNPGEFPVAGETFVANDIALGDFALSEDLISTIQDFENIKVTDDDATLATRMLGSVVQVWRGGFYLGIDPQTPRIGDVRVTYFMVEPGIYSVLAAQRGSDLRPFTVPKLGTIGVVMAGSYSAEEMFQAEHESNEFLAWMLRLAGVVFMTMGLSLILGPLETFASVVPLFGRIVSAGIGIIALLVAIPLSLLIIALSWLAFRPLLAVLLLALTVVSVVAAVRFLRRKRTPRTASNPA